VGTKGSSLTMEKPNKHYLNQLKKLTLTLISHADSIHPKYDMMRMAFPLCDIAPQTL
jgi:hypothetical protein